MCGSSKLTEYLGNIVPKAGPLCRGAVKPPTIACAKSVCLVSMATHREEIGKNGRTRGLSPRRIAPR